MEAERGKGAALLGPQRPYLQGRDLPDVAHPRGEEDGHDDLYLRRRQAEAILRPAVGWRLLLRRGGGDGGEHARELLLDARGGDEYLRGGGAAGEVTCRRMK